MDAESLESLIFTFAGQLQQTQQAATSAEEISPPPPLPPGAAVRNHLNPARESLPPGGTDAEPILPPALDVMVLSPIPPGVAGGL